jgi:hypothetical protein
MSPSDAYGIALPGRHFRRATAKEIGGALALIALSSAASQSDRHRLNRIQEVRRRTISPCGIYRRRAFEFCIFEESYLRNDDAIHFATLIRYSLCSIVYPIARRTTLCCGLRRHNTYRCNDIRSDMKTRSVEHSFLRQIERQWPPSSVSVSRL